MDLFDNMLARLASGDASVVSEGVDVSEYIDPVYENEIMESTLPIGELIRSGEADNHAEILQALETFEMEQILGSTKVILEGSGQAGAAFVMEGVIKRFFDAIVERLKKIVTWFKNLFRKLFKKVDEKAAEGKVAEAVEHIEGRSKAAKNEGNLDKHLTAIREDAKKGVEAAVNFCGDNFVFINYAKGHELLAKVNTVSSAYTSNTSRDVNSAIDAMYIYKGTSGSAKESKEKLQQNAAVKDNLKDGSEEVKARLIKEIFGKEGKDDAAVTKYVADAFGINDTGNIKKAETLPTASEFAKIFNAIEKKELNRFANKIETSVSAEIGRMIKLCEGAQKNYEDNNAFDKAATKTLTNLISSLNAALALFTGIIAKVVTTVTNYAGQYASIVNRAMSYKSKKDNNAATEGVEYMGFFMESDDVADVPEDPDEKDDDKGGKATTESYGGGAVSADALTAFMNSYI